MLPERVARRIVLPDQVAGLVVHEQRHRAVVLLHPLAQTVVGIGRGAGRDEAAAIVVGVGRAAVAGDVAGRVVAVRLGDRTRYRRYAVAVRRHRVRVARTLGA